MVTQPLRDEHEGAMVTMSRDHEEVAAEIKSN